MPPKRKSDLIEEIEALRARVEELEEVLRAIQSGEVDAIVASTPDGEQIFSLKGAESTYRTIIENISEGSVTLTSDGTVLYANSRFAEMLSTPLEKIIGAPFQNFLTDESRDSFQDLLEKGFKKSIKEEAVLTTAVKASLPVYLSLNPMPTEEVSCASMIITDLSERKRAEEALLRAYDEMEQKVLDRTEELRRANYEKEALIHELETQKLELDIQNEDLRGAQAEIEVSRRKYADLFNAAPVGYFTLDAQEKILEVNEAGAKLIGTTKQLISNKPFSLFVDVNDRATFAAFFRALMNRWIPDACEIRLKKWNGSSFYAQLQSIAATDTVSGATEIRITAVDITDRKQMEKQIRHQAHHDELTGLPNRRLFMDILTIELAKARRNQDKFAVLFLDLDRFKYINDTLGHDVGDELLKEVGERLKGSVRGSDIVARIGGDEFNILLSDIAHAEDIITIARKIIDAFREPYAIREHKLRVSTSVGISIYPDDAESLDSLFKNADIAMYHAKDLGGNAYQFYDAAMNIRTVELMKLESWLRQALLRGEMEVYYQPQITTDTRQVVCAEALVRWNHPEQGVLDPKHFIPLAEETGFITAIDEWVLRTACAQFKEWQDAGLPPLCVTVNLSAKQFQKSDLVERIARILQETGFGPEHLDIEVTESTAMKNLEHTIPSMARLADMGIGIAIDDFGTGYSSLNYLKKLPIHKLKIDRSFVQDLATDSDDRTIVTAVTALAQNMRLRVVAEGVETEEQLAFLNSIGCEEMQGFLFSRPLPAEEFRVLIANGT